MKNLLLAAAFATVGAGAMAGTAEAPGMDIQVITQSAGVGTDQNWIVPAAFAFLILLLLKSAVAPVAPGGGAVTVIPIGGDT